MVAQCPHASRGELHLLDRYKAIGLLDLLGRVLRGRGQEVMDLALEMGKVSVHVFGSGIFGFLGRLLRSCTRIREIFGKAPEKPTVFLHTFQRFPTRSAATPHPGVSQRRDRRGRGGAGLSTYTS